MNYDLSTSEIAPVGEAVPRAIRAIRAHAELTESLYANRYPGFPPLKCAFDAAQFWARASAGHLAEACFHEALGHSELAALALDRAVETANIESHWVAMCSADRDVRRRAEAIFDSMTAIEHRSWPHEMIVRGWCA